MSISPSDDESTASEEPSAADDEEPDADVLDTALRALRARLSPTPETEDTAIEDDTEA